MSLSHSLKLSTTDLLNDQNLNEPKNIVIGLFFLLALVMQNRIEFSLELNL
jgi:hypothetical protein